MPLYKKPATIAAGSAFRSAVIGDAPLPPVMGGRRGSQTQRFAERNRRAPTPAEKELARILREAWPRVEWIPQWAFGGKWILDFYFRAANVGVEADGSYHRAPMRIKRDEAKARACAARGIVLVRVTNAEVFDDPVRVLKKIREAFVRASQQRQSSRRSSS